jgi:hypothetical protein
MRSDRYIYSTPNKTEMKTDTYTKVVLTIIAIALTANLLKGIFISPAKADTKKFVAIPVNPDGSINVKFPKGETIDVNIVGTEHDAFYDAGPMEVKVSN